MSRRNWDFWGDPYDGAKHPDAPEPRDVVDREQPDDHYDAAAEHSPTGAWPENQQQEEQ